MGENLTASKKIYWCRIGTEYTVSLARFKPFAALPLKSPNADNKLTVNSRHTVVRGRF